LCSDTVPHDYTVHLHLYVEHPDLHSFPTRRSSDLRFSGTASITKSQSARSSRRVVKLRLLIAASASVWSSLPISTARRMPNRVLDRKSTRLNSSHVKISYAVFCLKTKKQKNTVRLT